MRGLLGLAALLAIAWALSEDRRRIPWRTVIAGVALQWALALLLLFFPPANAADLPAERRRHRVAERDAGRHRLRVRLSRRPAAAVRRDASRRQLHPRVPGAAAGADDQRAGVAAVLLGRAAADHRRLRLAAAPRDGHRRRAGAGRRGARVRRHDRGAAAGASLSRAHAARRTVRADDLRHGRRRRHGDGDLRLVPRAAGAERAGQHPDRLGDQHAGGIGGRGADGAVRAGGGSGGTRWSSRIRR